MKNSILKGMTVSSAYRIGDSSDTKAMKRLRCKDEGAELQELLEKNLNLLPGDQIRPEDPCRWILLKREMPVHDPDSGSKRWNIDFFLADQNGIPTFVECKRFRDTRSRREVVGQMLEYAANGQFYWDHETIRKAAEETVPDDIEDAVKSLEPDTGETSEDFFAAIENNLKEGQLRLVFFLEEAPSELKSIVDFLNRQMERTEVLIVEARMFEADGIRIVVPSLFGYTEQARRIKKVVTVSERRRAWNETDFFEEAESRLTEEQLSAVRRLYEFFVDKGLYIKWGTGFHVGSYNVVAERILSKSFLTVGTDGNLTLNLGWIHGSEIADTFRERLRNEVPKALNYQLPEVMKYPAIRIDDWYTHVRELLSAIDELLKQS